MPIKEQTSKHDNQATRKDKAPLPIERVLSPDLAGAQRAVLNPGWARPADILALQRAAGNRAVSRLIQAKLTVGPAGDRYEQEADRVAEQVVGGQPQAATAAPEAKQSGGRQPQEAQRQEDEEEIQTKPIVQRQMDEEEIQTQPLVQRQMDEEEIQTKPKSDLQDGFDAGPGLESRLEARRGGGSSLPDGVRAYMEPRFGADFSGVRLHTGADAVQMNQDIQARAFTHGQDIYFGGGGYEPGTTAGKRLVAHELTHVVQQTGAGVRRSVRRAGGPPPLAVSRVPAGLQRGVVQRDIQSYTVWKATSALDWKMRSGELKKIDKTLADWDLKKNHSDKTVKLAALTKLSSAIDRWLASKKQEKGAAKRNPAVLGLRNEVSQKMDELRPQGDNATLTLNVDVESKSSWNRTLYETANSYVGHAFLSLKYDRADPARLGGVSGFNEYNLKELRAGPTGNASFGFYPEWFTPDEDYRRLFYDRGGGANPAASTLAQPDKLHMPKVEKRYRVDDDKVQAIGHVIDEFKGRPYNMVSGPNCVTFAGRIIQAAGYEPPQFKLHTFDQANKMYRSVVRIGVAGDTAVTSQLEIAKQIARDGTKTYDNISSADARALNQMAVRHVDEARAVGLYDVRRQILPALAKIFSDAMPAAKQAMIQRDRAARWPDWQLEIATATADHDRIFCMQMAAAVLDDQEFSMWMPKQSQTFELQAVSQFMQDNTHTYASVTAELAPTLVRATVEGEAQSLHDVFMLGRDALFNNLYRLYHGHTALERAAIENSATRQATMDDWIQHDDERPDWSSEQARGEHIQWMAYALDSEAWPVFSRYARQNIRDNVAPKPRAS